MRNVIIKTACLSALSFVTVLASAQIRPFSNFQTPDVASLGTYGNIPVGSFTGTPDIRIQLLEVTAGDYTLPISASYHLANVSPFPIPGVLGLGWSLEAGGHITRTVRGFPDEKMDSLGNVYGFLGHYKQLPGSPTRTGFENALAAVFDNFKDNTYGNEYELMTDEYSFNFCGHSGRFYLNALGSWVVVSDEDIKVLFSVSDNTINLKQLESSGRLSTTGWTHRSQNNRFITGFTLLTPDGCRYEFGGIDATEFSIPYYNRANCDLVATTWHLSRIVTPDGREIKLTYMCKDSGKSIMTCDLRYSPQSTEYGNYNSSNGKMSNGGHLENTGWATFTGFLLFPSYLTAISTPNEKVSLSYSRDTNFSERLRQANNSCQAVYWSNKNIIIDSRFGSNIPANQFLMLVDKVEISNNVNTMRKNIANRMYDMRLDNITVTSVRGGGFRKIIPSFNNDQRRKLTSLKLTDGSHQHHYGFSYNPGKMCNYYPMAATDSWGYSTGGSVSVGKDPTYQYVPSSKEALMRETLSEITYPTGGKTCFEYELNTYTKRASYSTTHLINETNQAGGLRVSRITDRKSDNSIDKIRRFFYCENIADSSAALSASSGILSQLPTHVKHFISADGKFIATVKSKDAFSVPVTSDESPVVGYSSVIEQTIGSDGSSQGWVRRRYTNFDTDINGLEHKDAEPVFRLVDSDSTQVSPVTSLSYERGKLTSEEFFDASGNLVRKVRHRYGYTYGEPVTTMYHEESYYPNNGGAKYLQWGCLAKIHLRRYFETSVSDTLITPSGTYTTRTSRTYNNLKQPLSVTTDGSEYVSRAERYTYAHQKIYHNDANLAMANNHYITPVVSVAREVGSQTKDVDVINYSLTDGGVPYTESQWLYQDSKNTVGKELFRVTCADVYGNPLESLTDSLVTLMIWSYQGQRLIARADNVPSGTAAQHMPWLTGLSVRDPLESDYEAIAQLREAIPGSLFQIYRYDGWLNLLSHTEPNGHTTYYKHDAWGRLREEYIYDAGGTRRILNQYDYKYAK